MDETFIIQRRRVAVATVPLDAIRDPSLSYKARGLLTYLLSFAENTSLTQLGLASTTPEGIDAVRTGLLELANAGYLHRGRLREHGRLKGSIWLVFDVPTPREIAFPEEVAREGNSNVGFSNVGKTNVGKTYVGKTNVGKTNVGKPDLGESANTHAPDDELSDTDPEKSKHAKSGAAAGSDTHDTQLISSSSLVIIPAVVQELEQEEKKITTTNKAACRTRAVPKFAEDQVELAAIYHKWMNTQGRSFDWTTTHTATFKVICGMLANAAQELGLTREAFLTGLLYSGHKHLDKYHFDLLEKPHRFKADYSTIARRVVEGVRAERARAATAAKTASVEPLVPARATATPQQALLLAYYSAWNDWHKEQGEPERCKNPQRGEKLNDQQLAIAKRLHESFKNGRFTLTYHDVYQINKQPASVV